eukprot:TRINITY_DN1298_c0_g1_i1.p1 TRINITY_DN1298_c0_g1~~TRINITY_DN1298_c0_g1_i1.p1  ORF type:complete len:121 (-),score=44.61 TRINITY_DN1298_c0_g1_i1:18-380(-)
MGMNAPPPPPPMNNGYGGYQDNGYQDNGYGGYQENGYDNGYQDNGYQAEYYEEEKPAATGFLAALQNSKLKKVEVSETPAPAIPEGPSLLQTLSSAMAQRRIEIKEDEADDNDWDDDDWE